VQRPALADCLAHGLDALLEGEVADDRLAHLPVVVNELADGPLDVADADSVAAADHAEGVGGHGGGQDALLGANRRRIVEADTPERSTRSSSVISSYQRSRHNPTAASRTAPRAARRPRPELASGRHGPPGVPPLIS
jgi:hypothetical protein